MINNPNLKARYLVIEGAEASGKSTQVKLLIEYLTDRNIPAQAVREPGSTPAGEAIRNLNQHSEFDLDPTTELLLAYAARLELLKEVAKSLKAGYWVISDRNYLSTYAYQGYGQGMDMSTIDQVHRAVMPDNLAPDHTFVIDTSFATNQARLESQEAELDRFERMGPDFHTRVHRGYQELIKNQPNVTRVNGDQTIAAIHADIVKHLDTSHR